MKNQAAEPASDYANDSRVVMTLDAGGTNLVFSAIRGYSEIVPQITLPSEGSNLDRCLRNITEGFRRIAASLNDRPSAISFAFPGPADYPHGIIGDLANLPGFRGGVALGPMLERTFGIPAFINNDGDLFAYGEAIAGFLPKINRMLSEAGSPKNFSNLFGVTLGTGFGGGLVRRNELYIGDNAAGAEIWDMRNGLNPEVFAEEGVSIRAVRRVDAEAAGILPDAAPEPKEIYDIALGHRRGNRDAARHSYKTLGRVLGDVLANAITLFDGLIVVGGGLAGAYELFFPAMIEEMNRPIKTTGGGSVPRTELRILNLEDPEQLGEFIRGEKRDITIPGSYVTVPYDPLKRSGAGISVLGTSKAVGIGAYAFALHALDTR